MDHKVKNLIIKYGKLSTMLQQELEKHQSSGALESAEYIKTMQEITQSIIIDLGNLIDIDKKDKSSLN